MNLPPNMNLCLIVTPKSAPQAYDYPLPLAHYAYRIGNGPHLFRTDLRNPAHGGILVTDLDKNSETGNFDNLLREIDRECTARGYQGVFFDLEAPPSPMFQKMLESLALNFHRRKRFIYLPEPYAFPLPAVKAVVPTALSSGSLRHRLEQAAQRFSPERVALGVEWARTDFALPTTSSGGRSLTEAELLQLRNRFGHAIYFSEDLCAHYFTYMNAGNNAHFVLFDDAASISKKFQLAASLNIHTAFLPCPEEKHLLRNFLGQDDKKKD